MGTFLSPFFIFENVANLSSISATFSIFGMIIIIGGGGGGRTICEYGGNSWENKWTTIEGVIWEAICVSKIIRW